MSLEDAWYYLQNSNGHHALFYVDGDCLATLWVTGRLLRQYLTVPRQDLYLRNLDGDGETFALPTGTDFREKPLPINLSWFLPLRMAVRFYSDIPLSYP